MNVCFYTDQSISERSGGIGRVTHVLTEHFRKVFKWHVYSIYGKEAAPDCVRTETDGSKCLRLHDRTGLRLAVRFNTKQACELLTQWKVDVLIVQTSLDVARRLRNFLPDGSNMKIVTVLHFEPGKDVWEWESGWSLKGLLAPFRNFYIRQRTLKAYKDAYLYSDNIVVLSPSYNEKYRVFSQLSDDAKLVSIANPLSFQSVEAPKQVVKRGILVVARMEEGQKRISLVLHIIAKLGMDVPVWIVGDGPSLESYKKLAQNLHLTHVQFTGRQDPQPYYQQAAVFLMTSAFEGFPMTIIEAQQMGCVPMAYNTFSALDDVVEDGFNGLVIPDGDEDRFVSQLHILLHNEMLLSELRNNALTSCQRFSIHNIAQQWSALLIP